MKNMNVENGMQVVYTLRSKDGDWLGEADDFIGATNIMREQYINGEVQYIEKEYLDVLTGEYIGGSIAMQKC